MNKKEKTLQHHRENIHLYKAFRKMALEKCTQRKYYSAKAIIELIRWETKEASNGEFKINNNLAPLYTRIFVKEFPEYEEHFKVRKSIFDDKDINKAQLNLFNAFE